MSIEETDQVIGLSVHLRVKLRIPNAAYSSESTLSVNALEMDEAGHARLSIIGLNYRY